jgi:glycosyltransferase involved in cell wall biosynthesis
MSRGDCAPIRVTHVIAGLELGGAETMLQRLLSASDRERFPASVISLSDLGPVACNIAALGVPVSAIEMRRGRLQARPLGRLARRLTGQRPQIVHTWMYHADLLGGAFAHATGRIRADPRAQVIWGIRGSVDPKLSKRSSRLTARACALTERWLPDRVVSCSHSLAQMHVALGYDPTRMTVIPNGFDLAHFAPDPALRAQGRAWLEAIGERPLVGIVDDRPLVAMTANRPLVGIVGRYDPQKDHATFARAAAAIARARPDVRFVLAGPGIDSDNRELGDMLAREGVAGCCILTGPVADPRIVYNALDVLVSSSAFGEGFPNVIGEAMACGIPCVATDVGDAATIVSDAGRVVAIRDPAALARATLALLDLAPPARAQLGQRARARIERDFSLPGVAARFQELYLELAVAA